jgi:hypothetical protein
LVDILANTSHVERPSRLNNVLRHRHGVVIGVQFTVAYGDERTFGWAVGD